MKILKYVLVFILVLILLFFTIGLLNPSVDYGHEIEVSKSIEESWAVTQDESKYAEWLEGFKSMELLSGEKFAEGSTYKVIVNPGEGQADFEMIETVNSVKEYEYYDLSFVSDAMDFEQVTTFSEANGKTKIKTDSKVMGKGVMMRAMFALMEMIGGSFQKQEAKNMEALKVLIENNTTNYFPEPEPETEADLESGSLEK